MAKNNTEIHESGAKGLGVVKNDVVAPSLKKLSELSLKLRSLTEDILSIKENKIRAAEEKRLEEERMREEAELQSKREEEERIKREEADKADGGMERHAVQAQLLIAAVKRQQQQVNHQQDQRVINRQLPPGRIFFHFQTSLFFLSGRLGPTALQATLYSRIARSSIHLLRVFRKNAKKLSKSATLSLLSLGFDSESGKSYGCGKKKPISKRNRRPFPTTDVRRELK